MAYSSAIMLATITFISGAILVYGVMGPKLRFARHAANYYRELLSFVPPCEYVYHNGQCYVLIDHVGEFHGLSGLEEFGRWRLTNNVGIIDLPVGKAIKYEYYAAWIRENDD